MELNFNFLIAAFRLANRILPTCLLLSYDISIHNDMSGISLEDLESDFKQFYI